MERRRQVNRLKVVLAEKCRTNKLQPSVQALAKISDALDVDIRDLFNSTKD